MRLRLSAIVGCAVVALAGMLLATSAQSQFIATFDGNPSAPAAVGSSLPGFDVQVHSRDASTWFALEPIQAQHGSDCSPPPASHSNTSYEGSVYICRNHVMTALNTSGYGVIYLTPNQVFDFSNGGSITFELSTERMSTRDWWDVMISPYEENLAIPLLSDLSQGVDLNGTPMNAIHIGTDNGEGSPVLKLIQNGTEQSFHSGSQVQPPGSGIAAGVNQASTRQAFRFTVADGRMKFERLASPTAPALTFWDVAATAEFTAGIVQFGHHSYSPTKDGAGVPATWHWDTFEIAPSTPFTIIKADRRYTQGGTVNFASPAPANAYLRFGAVCRVRINGQEVARQPSFLRGQSFHPEHQSSYFVPIPAGTTSVGVTFAADGWYSGPCIAKDFSIWSLGGSGGSNPTNTPTTPPTQTPTPTPEVDNRAQIRGTVSLQGLGPASGITVQASPGGATATTAANGTFVLAGLEQGRTYSLTATAPGFVPAELVATIPQSANHQVPATTLFAGDVDRDGAVSIADVSIVAAAYGLAGGPLSGDFNRTGVIDISDVSLVATNYGLDGPTTW